MNAVISSISWKKALIAYMVILCQLQKVILILLYLQFSLLQDLVFKKESRQIV